MEFKHTHKHASWKAKLGQVHFNVKDSAALLLENSNHSNVLESWSRMPWDMNKHGMEEAQSSRRQQRVSLPAQVG